MLESDYVRDDSRFIKSWGRYLLFCLATDRPYLDRLSDSDRTAFTCVLYHIFAELLSTRLRSMDEELVKAKEENLRLKSRLNKLSA